LHIFLIVKTYYIIIKMLKGVLYYKLENMTTKVGPIFRRVG